MDAHCVSWSSQTSATARHTLSKPVRAPLSRLGAEISGKMSVQLPTHPFPPHCFGLLVHNRQSVTVFSSQLPFCSLVLGHLFAYLVTLHHSDTKQFWCFESAADSSATPGVLGSSQHSFATFLLCSCWCLPLISITTVPKECPSAHTLFFTSSCAFPLNY